MRILIVTQYFPPEDAFIPASVARHLSERGHQVRVLTGFPNYPSGTIFPGYKQKWRHHESDGAVDVLRVPLWMDHSENPALRFLNYASFGASAATAHSFARGADVVYVYATQMTPALAPWLWRLFGGAPYVLHVQDLWPDSITGSSLVQHPVAVQAVHATLTPWLSSLYRRSAAVIGIAPTMVDTLIKRGVRKHGAHLVYNWAQEDHIPQTPLAEANGDAPSTTRILYAGNVGDMQDLETAVRAAHQAAAHGVELTILGDGVALARVREAASAMDTTNVHFLGRVPADALGPHYNNADFALVTLRDLPVFRGTIPSKFQASLAWGKPVITSVQGDVRKIVQDGGLGFTSDAESVDSLTLAFQDAAAATQPERARMGARAIEAYSRRFSERASTEAIERILVAAASKAQP